MGEYVIGNDGEIGSIPIRSSSFDSVIVRSVIIRKRIKTMKNKKKETKVVYIGDEDSLEYILKQATDLGLTDFSKARIRMNYDGCRCDNEYCYCPSAYTDIRLEWEV